MTITVDDPGAFTASWSSSDQDRESSAKDFAREVWPCSVRENNEFNESMES